MPSNPVWRIFPPALFPYFSLFFRDFRTVLAQICVFYNSMNTFNTAMITSNTETSCLPTCRWRCTVYQRLGTWGLKSAYQCRTSLNINLRSSNFFLTNLWRALQIKFWIFLLFQPTYVRYIKFSRPCHSSC